MFWATCGATSASQKYRISNMAALQTSRGIFLSLNCLLRGTRPSLLARTCSSVTEVITEDEDFDEMLRNSQFVKLGRPVGKKVVGQVTHIVHREKDKDVYVDFGWKFHTVERFSLKRDINVGDKVEVTIKSLEATGHFLGQSKRITLNEAEARFKKIKDAEIT
ncbi:hypothetical protein QZH41_015599 [Actinostola sp. cb2023]|nr:hypothetical protein QZH41_015599 [Actinostola sp. cb2023]